MGNIPREWNFSKTIRPPTNAHSSTRIFKIPLVWKVERKKKKTKNLKNSRRIPIWPLKRLNYLKSLVKYIVSYLYTNKRGITGTSVFFLLLKVKVRSNVLSVEWNRARRRRGFTLVIISTNGLSLTNLRVLESNSSFTMKKMPFKFTTCVIILSYRK